MDKTIGTIFPVCDADQKHFDRFMAEMRRLGFPYAVHFDHCCKETKRFFIESPLCIGHYADDNPKSMFDESYRHYPAQILVKQGFNWMLQMDVDETLEKKAPEKIAAICKMNIDIAMARCLDLWGDDKHYRVDGPFQSGTREKIQRLKGNTLHYPSAISHAPNVIPHGKSKTDSIVYRSNLHILHWGIMNMEDAEVHRDRWHKIFMKKCGNIPYGSYIYYFDPTTVVKLADFDYDTFE